MLDLGSLAAAMGLQGEMQKVRDDAQCEVFNGDEVQEPSSVDGVVQTVEGALNAIEDTASTIVDAVNPAPYAASVFEAVAAGVPNVDLSLPTVACMEK